jgi:hypothetical protein
MLARRAMSRALNDTARLGRSLARAPAPLPAEVRSVLSELRHAEPGCGSDVLEV